MLIKCPECKKKISDQCANCPRCGYPIKNNSSIEEAAVEKSEIVATKKPFYKKAWVWIVAAAVLVVAILGVILFVNHDTKPKLDENGVPVFVELTNEVYTNAKNYKGYHVNIKGEVFQVMSDNGKVKGIQIWLDPDTCEQNLMVYYNTDVDVKQGDYVICSGYIDSIHKYTNAYGTKLYAPLVMSSDLRKSTYMEVMAPAIETIIPENLTQEKYGYSVSVEKIEFAEKETRVYVTVVNNGNSLFYFSDAVILQDGKQYNSTHNYEANYEGISYEIIKGGSSSGIVVFPAINPTDLELTMDCHSENFDERLGGITFSISKEQSDIKTPWPEDIVQEVQKPAVVAPTYPSAIGTYTVQASGGYVTGHLYIYSNGTLYREWTPNVEGVHVDTADEGTWVQTGSDICYNLYGVDGFVWNNPFYGVVHSDGIEFMGTYYKRQ